MMTAGQPFDQKRAIWHETTKRSTHMLRFFRRQRPAPTDNRLSLSEALTASAWGITEYEWLRLTDQARAHARANITNAPYFTN